MVLWPSGNSPSQSGAAVAAPRVGHAAARPAPFVLLEAVAQIALREQRQRQIEMGVGIVLLQRERLAETLRRFRVAVERLQRAAAIVPGARMRRDGGERAVEGGDRLGRAVELQQRVAAIVVQLGMGGRQLERGIEIVQRLGVTFERGQRDAAIEQRFAVARRALQHLLEAGERLLRAIEREQRGAAILQRVQIVRVDRQRSVEAVERVGIALERVQHVGEIDQRVGGARIDLDRGRDQPQRFAHLPALRLDGAEQMQRVESVRRGLQHAGIELFRLAQPVLPVQRDGLLHGLGDVELGGGTAAKLRTGRRASQCKAGQPLCVLRVRLAGRSAGPV